MRTLWIWILSAVALAVFPPVIRGTGTERHRLKPPVAGCPVCELWLQYEDVVLLANQEVGKLEDGVLFFFHSDDPAVIEPLVRFAHERRALAQATDRHPEIRQELGRLCDHARFVALPMRLEISTSARGMFALMRSSDSYTQGYLNGLAKRAVRSRYPVWF